MNGTLAVRLFVPWAFLGLFASPTKLLLVASAVAALAWRAGWIQRFLLRVASNQMRRAGGQPRAGPRPARAAARQTAPRSWHQLNWRWVVVGLIVLFALILVVSRAHVSRATSANLPGSPSTSTSTDVGR